MVSQQYQLVMRTGPTMGKAYGLGKNEVAIGRDPSNDIVINEAEVSRKHARLFLRGEIYVLEDLGSTNGTFVNGQRLISPQELRPGDMVLLGENEAAMTAAAWAAGLVASGGRLGLSLILTQEAFENVRQLMQSLAPDAEITPDSLADSLARSQFRLHRALQKASSAVGFKYRMEVLKEDDGSIEQATSHDAGTLLVLPLERGDHRSQGYVHHRIRQSATPLLVVPDAKP